MNIKIIYVSRAYDLDDECYDHYINSDTEWYEVTQEEYELLSFNTHLIPCPKGTYAYVIAEAAIEQIPTTIEEIKKIVKEKKEQLEKQLQEKKDKEAKLLEKRKLKELERKKKRLEQLKKELET